MAATLGSFWQQARRNVAAGAPSPFIQAVQAVELRLRRGLGPAYYHTAGLWRPSISRADRLGHINDHEYHAFLDRMNDPAFQKVSQHKITEKAVLELMGVPTPRFLAHVRAGPTAGPMIGDAAALAAFARAHAGQRIAVKEVEGFGGRGFRAFDIAPDGALFRSLKDNSGVSAETLWADVAAVGGGGYIVEAYLEQHPWYAALNASSVNTFRVWVCEHGGTSEIVLAYLRVGRAGDLVDNKSAGGILTPVRADGTFGPLTTAKVDRLMMDAHPDTGVRVAGEKPPLLDTVYDVARQALAAFPHTRFAGLDIAVGTAGPVVIEMNVRPGREGAVRCDVPFRDWIRARGL